MIDLLSLTPNEITAIQLSLKVSITALIFSLPVGIFFAYILARYSFFGKTILDALINLPLVMPPVITGYILLIIFGRNGVIGGFLYNHFDIVFAFDWKGAALASAIVSLPLMVRTIRVAIEQIDVGYENVAATLGAGRIKIFFTITIPLALNGIIAGTVIFFARSLGEFGATITFVSNIPGKTNTIPIEIYSLINTPSSDSSAIITLSVISILIAFLSLILSEILIKRSMKFQRG